MWLYSLALLDITPSPTWCAAFVEASFTRFTAQEARPQVGCTCSLHNAIQSVCCGSHCEHNATTYTTREARVLCHVCQPTAAFASISKIPLAPFCLA